MTASNGSGVHADAVSTAVQRVTVLAPATSDLAPGDMGILVHAVQARMARLVAEGFSAAAAAHAQDPAAQLRDALLECLHAMDQLHSMGGPARHGR